MRIDIRLLFVYVLSACNSSKWIMPDVEDSENSAPRVLSVEFSDTCTLVEMEKKVSHGFQISHASVLLDESLSAASLRWMKNVQQSDGQYHDTIVRFQLGFAPIKKKVRRLDFLEGSGERDYRIWSIRKKGKKLADYTYSPTHITLAEQDHLFLGKLLERHAGKVILLQLLGDMDKDETFEALRKTSQPNELLQNSDKAAIVFVARPDGKEFREGTRHVIIISGVAAEMKSLSSNEYNRLSSFLSRYISTGGVVSFDSELNILVPGLMVEQPQILKKQIDLIK